MKTPDGLGRDAGRYAERMIDRFLLGPKSLVVEVASNGGYLLQHFPAAGVPVLGIEPAANVEHAFRDFVAAATHSGRRVAVYGAATKGNTLLNTCGVGAEDILFVADQCPAKQGKLLPGSHIPMVTPAEMIALHPDDVVILPWNLVD